MQNMEVEEIGEPLTTSWQEVSNPPVLPGFLVRRMLGRGGTATVWLVVEASSGLEYALKVMSAQGPRFRSECDEKDATAPWMETHAVGRYGHPHLICVHALVTTDQGPGLLMDYAAGGSLAELVAARGPLSIGETVTLLAPVAQAISYLHGEGIAHGDVAPGNVLFSAEGKPMLADLGLSRTVGAAPQDYGILSSAEMPGTPGFTAPDSRDAAPRGSLRPQADIYSLGALAWFALTGRVPAPTQERPPLGVVVPDVPAELRALVEEALQDEPGKRPTAAEFARAVLASAPAAPLDLVASAHATVQPRLLTRRDANAGRSRGSRRGVGRWFGKAFDRRMARGATILGAVLVGVAAGAGALTSAMPTLSTGNTGLSSSAAASPTSAAPTVPSSTVRNAPSPAAGQSPPAEADPRQAVRKLASLRARAFSLGQPRLLAAVNAENSPAMEADAVMGRRLADYGYRLAGLTIRTEQVRLMRPDGDGRPVVRLLSIMSGYRVVDRQGQVVREQPEQTIQRLEFVLEDSTGTWRITRIRTLDPASV